MQRATVDLSAYGVAPARPPRWGVRATLLALAALFILADLYLIFMWAPEEANQGQVYRVIYFHVPIAVFSLLAFVPVFLGSVLYLLRRSRGWDSLAHVCAEVGLVFATLALVTGSIWARPIWGVWWTWDPRLTTTLILWLIYVAYLMVRAYAPTAEKAARYAAVVGIIGFVDVPIVYMAVEWWRSVHPSAVVGPLAEEGSMAPEMRAVLLFSLVTFALLFTSLVLERLALRRLEGDVRGMTQALADADAATTLPGPTG